MIFVKLKEPAILTAFLQSTKREKKRFFSKEISDTYSFDKGDVFYFNANKKRYYLIFSSETEPMKAGFRLFINNNRKVADLMEPATIYIPNHFMSVYGDMTVSYTGKKTSNIVGMNETILEYNVVNKGKSVLFEKIPLLEIQYFFDKLTQKWEGDVKSVLNREFKVIEIGKTQLVAKDKHYIASRCTLINGIVDLKFKEFEKVNLRKRIPKNSVITKEEYSKLTNTKEEVDHTPKGLAMVCKNAIHANKERYKTSFRLLPIDSQIKALKLNILKFQFALLKGTITKEELESLTADYILLTRLQEWEKSS